MRAVKTYSFACVFGIACLFERTSLERVHAALRPVHVAVCRRWLCVPVDVVAVPGLRSTQPAYNDTAIIRAYENHTESHTPQPICDWDVASE